MKTNKLLEHKLQTIPSTYGVYLWKNEYDQIIYIGKAINLKKRIHQYLDKKNTKQKMMDEAYDIDFISTKNEKEAFLLENNLIKKHQPKFNILLKNGSGYPYIVLTKETNPRLLYTTEFNKYKGKYWGPFPPTHGNKYELYKLLLQLFPLRKCNILKKEKCLYYDIGQCLGPCINHINIIEYENISNLIKDFFLGKNTKIFNDLKIKRKKAISEFNFERAKKYYEMMLSIKNVTEKQNIILKTKINADFIGFYEKDKIISIVVHTYIGGKLLLKNKIIFDLYEESDQALISYILQFYIDNNNKPNQCYINIDETSLKLLKEILNIDFISPQKSKYKSILNSAMKNAKQIYHTDFLVYNQKKHRTLIAFNEFKQIINITNLTLIHVFDISNTKDVHVAGMITLKDGFIDKKNYKKFIIEDIKNISDVDCIKEVIQRQYKNTLKNKEELPNLIIIDGGLLQINAVYEALKQINLSSIIPIIGLSKDHFHKTDKIVKDDKQIIKLQRGSGLYYFLSNIQEEVHRFAITFLKRKTANIIK